MVSGLASYTLLVLNWTSKLWAAVLSARAFSRPSGCHELHNCSQGCSALCFKLISMQLPFSGCFHCCGATLELSLLPRSLEKSNSTPGVASLPMKEKVKDHIFIHSIKIY